MSHSPVKIIGYPGGRRGIVIYRRKAGTYGYSDEFGSDDPYERCWIRREASAICGREETALYEAKGRLE